MRLLRIKARRFFGIDTADIQLGGGGSTPGEDGFADVTLLVGANGSGKSSVIKAVQFFVEHYPYQAPELKATAEVGKVGRNGLVSPFISLKKDNGFECRARNERRDGRIELTFTLSRDEQVGLLSWRRLGLLNHVKEVLEHVLDVCQTCTKNDIVELNALIAVARPRRRDIDKHIGDSNSDRDSEDDDSGLFHDDDTSDTDSSGGCDRAGAVPPTHAQIWNALNNHLQMLHAREFVEKDGNPFSRLSFTLATVATDPSVAEYEKPIFHSASGTPAGAEVRVAQWEQLTKRETSVIDKILVNNSKLSPNAKEVFRAALQRVHVPSPDLRKHIAEYWHAVPVVSPTSVKPSVELDKGEWSIVGKRRSQQPGPHGRQFTLDDDLEFQRHHRMHWRVQDKFYYIHPTSAQMMVAKQGGKIAMGMEIRKTIYDGSAVSDKRHPCRHGGQCTHLVGRGAYRTRNLTDPLLVPLLDTMPFPDVKFEVQEFVTKLTDAAFPEGPGLCPDGFRKPPLKKRSMAFIMHALLRTSVAILQQDRSRRTVLNTKRVPFPLPGLFDFAQAQQLLIRKCHAHNGIDEETAAAAGVNPLDVVSRAMKRTLGVEICITHSQKGRDGRTVAELLIRTASMGDIPAGARRAHTIVSLEHGSGGHKEVFTVLVAALVADYSTLFVDEPGHNVHPGAQIALLQELQGCGRADKWCRRDAKALLLITHTERLVTKESIERCYVAAHQNNGCVINTLVYIIGEAIPPRSRARCIDPCGRCSQCTNGHKAYCPARCGACQACLAVDKSKLEQLTLPPLSQLLFTRRVILVEGPADFRILSLLQEITHGSGNGLLHDIIFVDGGGDMWPLEVACRLGLDVRLMLDVDKIVSPLSKGSQQRDDKTATLLEVKARAKNINALVKHANPFASLPPARNRTLQDAIDNFGRHRHVFEHATDDEQATFKVACTGLREAIWNATDGRVFVLGRDLEEEFLRHDELLRPLTDIYNAYLKTKGPDKEFAAIDSDHALQANVYAHLCGLKERLDASVTSENSRKSSPKPPKNGNGKKDKKGKSGKNGKNGNHICRMKELVDTALGSLMAATCEGCKRVLALIPMNGVKGGGPGSKMMASAVAVCKKWTPEVAATAMQTTFSEFAKQQRPPATPNGHRDVAVPAAAGKAPTTTKVTVAGCCTTIDLRLGELLHVFRAHANVPAGSDDQAKNVMALDQWLMESQHKLIDVIGRVRGKPIDPATIEHRLNNIKEYSRSLMEAVMSGSYRDDMPIVLPARVLSRRSELWQVLHSAWKSIPFRDLMDLVKCLKRLEMGDGTGFPSGVVEFVTHIGRGPGVKRVVSTMRSVPIPSAADCSVVRPVPRDWKGPSHVAEGEGKGSVWLQAVEAGGGGHCIFHALEFLRSGKKNQGKLFFTEFDAWSSERPPKWQEFEGGGWHDLGDWVTPHPYRDFWKHLQGTNQSLGDLPFSMEDPDVYNNKKYVLDALYDKLRDEKDVHEADNENSQASRLLRDPKGAMFIIGSGCHWMPLQRCPATDTDCSRSSVIEAAAAPADPTAGHAPDAE